MDIQSMLFGRRSLVLNPALLERQLLQELEARDASHTTGLALGFDNTIFANPVAASLVVDQYAPALAAIAGQMRGVLAMCVRRERFDEEPVDHFEKEIAVATMTLDKFDQVFRLAQTLPAGTRVGIRDNQGNSIIDAGDDGLPSIDEILAETGGPETPEEVGARV